MLDTNVISDLIKDPMGKVARQLEVEGESSVCSSIIGASELRYGVTKSGSKEISLRVDAALSAIEILPFDIPADTEYGIRKATCSASSKRKAHGPQRSSYRSSRPITRTYACYR